MRGTKGTAVVGDGGGKEVMGNRGKIELEISRAGLAGLWEVGGFQQEQPGALRCF